jgi:hypothetical protein
MPDWLESAGYVVGAVAFSIGFVLVFRNQSWFKKWRSHV